WGTDCLWWGSPQWAIDLLKRFQFTDEMTEKFGYRQLTREDKAKIFGLNAARLYKVKVKAKRGAISASMIEKFKKREWAEDGTGRTAIEYSGRPYGWVRAED
ncbi:MAG: amidohydrolase, partial [Acidobacteria bacterium]|nr:amidohydrolase [Acidobacteriota bacterium]